MTGIAGMESMKAVAKMARRAAFTLKLSARLRWIIGLIIVNRCAARRDERRSGNAGCAGGGCFMPYAKEQGIIAFLMDVIPGSVTARLPAQTSRILLFAVLFGLRCTTAAKASSFSM
ncbi:hypothetical protein KCP78_17995 [Salmonella enterica subsp. enterica]|nr:hypothetical protein KCP78_17995 [Salmonella enterica subsp. enterica]